MKNSQKVKLRIGQTFISAISLAVHLLALRYTIEVLYPTFM